MVYVWSWPKGIPDRYHVRLDYERSPDYSKVRQGGERLPEDFGTIHYACKAEQKKLRRLHVLPTGALIIVSPEVRQVLETHAKDCVQFMPLAIRTLDGVCTDYTALHVLPVVHDVYIDHQASFFRDGTRYDPKGEKKEICHAVYKENCLGHSPIAISNIWFKNILVSDALNQQLSVFADTGLVTQEEAVKYFFQVDSRSPYAVKGSDWKDS